MQSSENPYEQLFETETIRAHLKSKAIRGGIFTLTAEGANLVLNIASTAVLARILTPTDFGLLGMVFALTTIAERFKDIGLSTATIQKKTITHSEVSNLFWINAAVGLLIALFLSLLSGTIASFYHEQRLTYIAIVASTSFLFSGLTIQYHALLRRRMRFGAIAVISTGSQFLSSILAVLLALKGYAYWSLVWKELSRNILVAIGTWALCPWIPGLPDRKTNVSRLLLFGRDITLFNVITFFTRSVDQILLGRVCGANALGIYRQAFQLIMVPTTQLAQPIQSVSESALSALQSDVLKYRRAFQKAVTALSMMTMPVAACIFVCSNHIVVLLLGARWSGAGDTLKILALAAFVRPAVSAMGFVMVTCGRTTRYAIIGLVDSIVLVAAVSLGVKWGPEGVACGHVAATYVVLVPFLWCAFRGTPVDVKAWVHAGVRPAVSSLLMAGILYFLSVLISFQSNINAVSFFVSVGAVCYLGTMMALPGGGTMLRELVPDFVLAFNRTRTSRATNAINER